MPGNDEKNGQIARANLEQVGVDDNTSAKEESLLLEGKLTIPQAAKTLGIGTTSLRRIIAEGRIPVLQMTGRTLLLEADLRAFIAASRVWRKKVTPRPSRLPQLPAAVLASEHLR